MTEFIEIIDKLKEEYRQSLDRDTGEAYSRLSTFFEELNGVVRERIQELTAEEIKAVIKKLEKDEALSNEDKEKIRLWIVGDAEYYTQLENNYDDWKKELDRLVREIEKLNVQEPDVPTLFSLQALLRDGSRVLADIFYFKEQQDRLKKFLDSTKEIDPEERRLLIQILQQKLDSFQF